jgi:regulator of RNase E activity RraA
MTTAALLEPWDCAVAPAIAREIPADLAERFRTQPDIVEELADGLRQKLGVESTVDLGRFACNRERFVCAGPVLTVRYAPRRVRGNDLRLGHEKIGGAAVPGCVVLVDARGCEGSVLGGNAARVIAGGGAALYIVDGLARDIEEVNRDTDLIVMATSFGVRSGRQVTQVAAIGEPITFVETYAASGDVAVVNRSGVAIVPSWVSWDAVREVI